MSEVRDRWAAGSMYEEFMGRWSRRMAPLFVEWIGAPSGMHWLDVGCGTGSLTNAICAGADPASVVGCDPAEPFIDYARRHSADARASFVVAGANSLPGRPGGYGEVTSSLALNFFPDIPVAVRRMRSLAAPGGAVSACVWDYAEGMEFLRLFWDAAIELDPAARDLDEAVRFPICRAGALARVFVAADLGNVRCDSLEMGTVFSGFEDFWRPLQGGTGPAPTYVASLDDHRRHALARRLDASLPRSPEGAIALKARAWAVRGTVRQERRSAPSGQGLQGV